MTTEEKHCPNLSATPALDNKTDAAANSHDEANRVAKIRELNDRLRMNGLGGMWLATIGISSLPPDDLRAVFKAVLTFNDFNSDNNPHGEHDCAVQTVGDTKIIWKIDYYDRDRQFHSPDPSNPKVTVRVLTVMLASEY
jgi:hypothetical protein